MHDSNYTVLYTDNLVNLLTHTGNVGTTSSWQEFHTVLNDDWIKPAYHITTLDRTGSCVVRMAGDSGKVGFKNVRNASESINGVYSEMVWKRRT